MNMIKKIEAVLEEKVRPSLLAHEGNVQILEFTKAICTFPSGARSDGRTFWRMKEMYRFWNLQKES